MTMRRLDNFIYGAILASTWIFLKVFLQISVIVFQMLAYCQTWHPAVSDIHYFYAYSLTLMLTTSLEVANKWHLSALLFNKLFSNHSNKTFDVFYKDAVTPLISSAKTYRVLSFAKFTISTSFKMKNKSAKKILNNNEPKL